MAGSMRAEFPVRYAATVAPGRREGALRVEPGWWNRYHNQLLVMALIASVATAILFLLIGDTSGYPVVWVGLGFGVGWTIGFLLSYRKQYARITAGEFRRENMSRRQRLVRDLSVPVAAVIFVVFLAYFVQSGMFGQIIAFMLGLSLIGWTTYGITILWERRHRITMIAERGSVYTMDAATEGENA